MEIQKEDRNFLVGVHFNQNRNGIDVSSIRGIFPKDNAEWLNWISQDKSLYLNKEKIQALIDKQRKTLADVEYLDLNSVTKLIKDFEKTTLEEEKISDTTPFDSEAGVNFRLSEEASNILDTMEQRNEEAYNSATRVELPEAETPLEIARNKKMGVTFRLFTPDQDFASMKALNEAMRQTELYKYNQSGRLSKVYKGLFDSMNELHNLIQTIPK